MSDCRPEMQLQPLSEFFFIEIDTYNGKIHPKSPQMEALRQYVADQRKQKRQYNKFLHSDASVRQITSGWKRAPPASSEGDSEGTSPASTPEPQNVSCLSSAPSDHCTTHLEHLLDLYLETVVPIALSFSSRWTWCADARRIRSCPMLLYAAAGYAAAFITVFGDEGPNTGGAFTWLYLQTKSLPYLRQELEGPVWTDDCAQTVMLFMRLALLLEEFEIASIHLKALQKILHARGANTVDMKTELAFLSFDRQQVLLEQLQRRNSSGTSEVQSDPWSHRYW
ncbi:uncharacterized protein A1O5_06499 [Cladophialophora psammophila CBS 110553]|uniref:Uncharacterized protein n=1 Tax=Cladophialophora psammophila CBS 110553 TaxID=1182543 RepID=W9X0J6_9EURO|nr:uncharacterized protein A1O5_06499 [Cladophialophora psammophila CBS 110553]EXJ70431.1 hypothetical protein A1O5_06499 [Cladophialophora psammophila CBS 110553]